MKTNPDSFENDLQSLRRRELPEDWRNEMLLAAAAAHRGSRPPRWLVAGWSLAWAAILMMYFTTPTDPVMPQSAHVINAAPPMLLQQRAAAIEALLAAN